MRGGKLIVFVRRCAYYQQTIQAINYLVIDKHLPNLLDSVVK